MTPPRRWPAWFLAACLTALLLLGLGTAAAQSPKPTASDDPDALLDEPPAAPAKPATPAAPKPAVASPTSPAASGGKDDPDALLDDPPSVAPGKPAPTAVASASPSPAPSPAAVASVAPASPKPAASVAASGGKDDPDALLDDPPSASPAPKPAASAAVAAASPSPAPSPSPSPAVAAASPAPASPKPAASVAASGGKDDPEALLDDPPSAGPGKPASPAPIASAAVVAASPSPAPSPSPSPAAVAASPAPASPKPLAAASVAPSPKPSAVAKVDDLGDDILDPAPSPSAKPAAPSPKPSPKPSAVAKVDDLGDDILDGPAPSPSAGAPSAKPPAVVAKTDDLGDDLLDPAPAPSAKPGAPAPKPSAVAKVDDLGEDLLDGPATPVAGPTAPKPSSGDASEIDLELTEAPPPTAKTFSNSIGMKFAWLPPGSFMMGKSIGDNEAELGELPTRKITFPNPISMGMFEVTQAEFRKVLGIESSRFRGADHPADTVSWDEANAFCKRLTRVEGKKYRLPTEAEWEYACRAGTVESRYAKRPLGFLAWYRVNSGRATHSVGKKAPNAWGLYDMLGNVSEWCEDSWHETYIGAPYSPTAWVAGPGGLLETIGVPLRVRRGGHLNNYAAFCRSSHRAWSAQAVRPSDYVGFRVLLEQ